MVTINAQTLYEILTSESQEDINMGYAMSKHYKGTNKKIIRLINYYKILKKYEVPLNLKLMRLDLSHSNITIDDLPEGLRINGLSLRSNRGLKKLPKNMVVDSLDIRNTNIKELPKDIKLGSIYYSNTPLEKSIKEGEKLIYNKITYNEP